MIRRLLDRLAWRFGYLRREAMDTTTYSGPVQEIRCSVRPTTVYWWEFTNDTR